MIIGFFGGYQQDVGPFTTNGRSFSTAGTKVVSTGFASWTRNNATALFQYLPDNTGTTPTQQSLTGTSVTFNRNGRTSFDKTVSQGSSDTGSIAYQGLIGVSRAYTWNPSSLWPSTETRRFLYRFHNPQYIRAISYNSSGAAFGDFYTGALKLPYLPNCEAMRLQASTTQIGGATLPSITGNWPVKLKTLILLQGANLMAIEKKFPVSLKHLQLTANAALAPEINTLIGDCTQLESLVFSIENWAEQGASGSAFLGTGTLQLSPIEALKMFSIGGALLTDITFSDFRNMVRWNVSNCTALKSETFLDMLNDVLQSPSISHVNGSNNNLAFSRTFVDNDFKPSLIYLWLDGNRISAPSFTLSTPRPAIVRFKLGDGAVLLTNAAKNNIEAIDISGVTNAELIDISNCSARQVILPVNTTVRELFVGGNRINVSATENIDFINKIRGMTQLVNLYLSISHPTSVLPSGGQDGYSLGEVNLAPLSLLINLFATACGITGVLTIPPSLTSLTALSNPAMTGLTSTNISGLKNIRVNGCTLFNFDYTRTPNLELIIGNGSGNTLCDLSNRSSVVPIRTIDFTGCTSLTRVKLPAAAASMVMDVASTYYMGFINCPLLTDIENLENISYDVLTGTNARPFRASGSALNIDFKIGINNFLPTIIALHDNRMDTAHVDLNIDNIYQNRAKWTTTIAGKTFNISGNNAAATGVYQGPAGFVQGVSDGTPASAKEQVYVLVFNYGWTITVK